MGITAFVALMAFFASCKKTKDCKLDLSAYNSMKGIVTADSNKVVSYFGTYENDAPKDFKDLVEYFMTQDGMTREQAWEAALCGVRDYPEYYSKEANNYVNTYFGLIDAFEQSKKSRDAAYKTANDDYENCKTGR